jgi:hypothetical protein
MRQGFKAAVCASAALALTGCASGASTLAAGPNLYPVASADALVDMTMGFINAVVEGCVDSMEGGKTIAELHAASGEFVLETNPEARRAANLKDSDKVWRPKRGTRLVTLIESEGGCTVGANGPPLIDTYVSLSLVLKNARRFGEVDFGEGPVRFQRQTKMIGDRQLSVLLTGSIETPSRISTLLATVSWKDGAQ